MLDVYTDFFSFSSSASCSHSRKYKFIQSIETYIPKGCSFFGFSCSVCFLRVLLLLLLLLIFLLTWHSSIFVSPVSRYHQWQERTTFSTRLAYIHTAHTDVNTFPYLSQSQFLLFAMRISTVCVAEKDTTYSLLLIFLLIDVHAPYWCHFFSFHFNWFAYAVDILLFRSMLSCLDVSICDLIFLDEGPRRREIKKAKTWLGSKTKGQFLFAKCRFHELISRLLSFHLRFKYLARKHT